MSKRDRIICGLDIGTTKVCMIIARARGGSGLEILATGYAHSRGLKKGLVVDLEEAAASIRKAAEEAESRSGISVDWVAVGISGDHVQSFNCHGAITIEGKHNEVSPEDMAHVIHVAQSIPIPPGREVIHVLPQEFLLDSRGEIQNPVGLTGSRLDVHVHLVSTESFLIQNIVNAVNRAQMRVTKVILQQLASAEAVLTPDERELGVVILDIGGGTTDIALMVKNAVRHTSVLPVGGDHFTRDLAVGLRTPMAAAEQVKKESGTVKINGIADHELVPMAGVGDEATRDMSRRVVGQILRDRALEVLELVKDEIDRTGERDRLSAGAVLTGGGSLLNGMVELAQEILEMPVRQGLPFGVKGMTRELSHPVYATAIGLAKLGSQIGNESVKRTARTHSKPWFIHRFLSWVSN